MTVASRKESYHARSRRPPRGEKIRMDYDLTEVTQPHQDIGYRILHHFTLQELGYYCRNILSVMSFAPDKRSGIAASNCFNGEELRNQ